eukprot:1195786-Prorocentrum_minimum.AAC.11
MATIAILWLRLPSDGYDCHPMATIAIRWLRLPSAYCAGGEAQAWHLRRWQRTDCCLALLERAPIRWIDPQPTNYWSLWGHALRVARFADWSRCEQVAESCVKGRAAARRLVRGCVPAALRALVTPAGGSGGVAGGALSHSCEGV